MNTQLKEGPRNAGGMCLKNKAMAPHRKGKAVRPGWRPLSGRYGDPLLDGLFSRNPSELWILMGKREHNLVAELFCDHHFLISQFAFGNGSKAERAEVISQMLGEIPQDLQILDNRTRSTCPSAAACTISLLFFAELLWRNPLTARELKLEMDKSPPDSEAGTEIHRCLASPHFLGDSSLFPSGPEKRPPLPKLDFSLRAYPGAFP